jgi:phage protein D
MVWKDTTSYSRGQDKPTTWSIEDPDSGLRVTVVFGYVGAPGRWFFHCQQLGFDAVEMPGVPESLDAVELAKKEAVAWCKVRLGALTGVLSKISDATP